jgi:hypothetical protein
VNGVVFKSHEDWGVPSPKHNWEEESGVACFRVSLNIAGDFSLVCHFNGERALEMDITTLICKYQNNTAFLQCRVVELTIDDVDVNPMYDGAFDEELFRVLLTFEKATAETSTASTCVVRGVGA